VEVEVFLWSWGGSIRTLMELELDKIRTLPTTSPGIMEMENNSPGSVSRIKLGIRKCIKSPNDRNRDRERERERERARQGMEGKRTGRHRGQRDKG